jgi:uncharacterized protein YbaR (Trm112 family)
MTARDSFAQTLVCPETRQTLGRLDEEALEKLNEAIRNGDVTNEAGDTLDRPLEAGLMRADEAMIYPIRDGVPNLLIPDRIPFVQE